MIARSMPTIAQIKALATPILVRYGARRAGVFGSVVTGRPHRGSDIDLLVELPEQLSLFGVVGLKLELEEALGRKVDLVEYDTIKPLLKERILREEISIL